MQIYFTRNEKNEEENDKKATILGKEKKRKGRKLNKKNMRAKFNETKKRSARSVNTAPK